MCDCLLFRYVTVIKTCLDQRSALCSHWAARVKGSFYIQADLHGWVEFLLDHFLLSDILTIQGSSEKISSIYFSLQTIMGKDERLEGKTGKWRWAGTERRENDLLDDAGRRWNWNIGGRKREGVGGVKIAFRKVETESWKREWIRHPASMSMWDTYEFDGPYLSTGSIQTWCGSAHAEVNGAKLTYNRGLCEQWFVGNKWAPVCVH